MTDFSARCAELSKLTGNFRQICALVRLGDIFHINFSFIHVMYMYMYIIFRSNFVLQVNDHSPC